LLGRALSLSLEEGVCRRVRYAAGKVRNAEGRCLRGRSEVARLANRMKKKECVVGGAGAAEVRVSVGFQFAM
jgi:hypothetical protein